MQSDLRPKNYTINIVSDDHDKQTINHLSYRNSFSYNLSKAFKRKEKELERIKSKMQVMALINKARIDVNELEEKTLHQAISLRKNLVNDDWTIEKFKCKIEGKRQLKRASNYCDMACLIT